MLQCFVSWILINYSLILSFVKVWRHFYECLSNPMLCYYKYDVHLQMVQLQAIICTVLFVYCWILHNKWINKWRCCCCIVKRVPKYSDPFRFHILTVSFLIIIYEMTIFKILSQFVK